MPTATNKQVISAMYSAVFSRAPDAAGLAFWETQFAANAGNAIAALAAGFAQHPVFTETYGTMNNLTFVQQIYQNVLGGPGDDAGVLYWNNLLTNGLSRADMLASFVGGALTIDLTDPTVTAGLTAAELTAATARQNQLTNKANVGLQFTALLGANSNLDPATDTTTVAGLAADPAYLASQAAIRSVTNDPATAVAAIAVLNAAAADADPVAYVNTNAPAAAVAAGTTFTLTTGADTGTAFTGTANNDTFNAADVATGTTWTVGDAIDGGAGTDVFNIIRAAAIALPTAATVTNIETVNATSGATVVLDTTTGFSGLTALNTTGVGGATVTAASTTAISVTDTALAAGAIAVNGGSAATVSSTGQTTGTITVGATTAAAGAVSVTTAGVYADGANNTVGAIAVTGGTTVAVTVNSGLTTAQLAAQTTDASNFTETLSAVSVTGNASTTAVTVTQAAQVTEVDSATIGLIGITNNTVTIVDGNAASAADTLTTVTLNNFGASTVASAALTTVNLTGGTTAGNASGSLGLNISAADTTTFATTLGLNMTSGFVGAISGTQAAKYTTVNVASAAASTIADITFAAATALNVSGAGITTFTANSGIGLVTAITSTGGGASFGTALATGVTFTGGDGADTVSLGATTKTITMGAGNDTVTTAGLVGTGGSVAGGDGTDTLIMTGTNAAAADNSATFNTKFTGFETLKIITDNATALDLAGLNAVSTVDIGFNGTHSFTNMVSGGTLKLTTANTSTTAGITNATFSATDVLNLQLNAAGVTAYGTVVAAGVETINISTADAVAAGSDAAIDALVLQATGATSIVVSGNNGLNMTNTGNILVTNFDASGVVNNNTVATSTVAATTDTAANLAVTFASANTTVGAAVTIKGGAGNDTLTGGVTIDTITGGEGADIITGGAANDSIILTETTAAIDKVVFSGGAATTVLALAANGLDTITGWGSIDTINLAALGDTDAAAATVVTTAAATIRTMVDTNIQLVTTSGAAGNLTTGGTAVVTDWTNLTQVAAYLSEGFQAASAATTEANAFVINDSTTDITYIYNFINETAAVTILSTEIALIGTINNGGTDLATGNIVFA